MNKDKFCGNCRFLNITEDIQNMFKLNKISHRCTLFNIHLLHREYHPELPRCEECMNTTIKNDVLKMIFREEAEK
jgi:hypothetical protein